MMLTQNIEPHEPASHRVEAEAHRPRHGGACRDQRQQLHPQRQEQADEVKAMAGAEVRHLQLV